MLNAARFLQKSLEADLAAQMAETDHGRDHFAELVRAWPKMAEEALKETSSESLAA